MSAQPHKLRSIRNAVPAFIRPLGCCEHFFHLYAQVYPVHFCLCAEIEGAVDSDALRWALNQVRERHPILKACIVDDGEFGAAFYESDRPIELETIAVGKEADWRPTVERELKKPMGIGVNALLRATVLCAPEITVIVLTFYHAIADALSGIWVLQDVMRALAGANLRRFSPFLLASRKKSWGLRSVPPTHGKQTGSCRFARNPVSRPDRSRQPPDQHCYGRILLGGNSPPRRAMQGQ
jgi:Condensation domain